MHALEHLVSRGADREDTARTIVHLMLQLGDPVKLLQSLNNAEILRTSDSATLFRSNSLASKVCAALGRPLR